MPPRKKSVVDLCSSSSSGSGSGSSSSGSDDDTVDICDEDTALRTVEGDPSRPRPVAWPHETPRRRRRKYAPTSVVDLAEDEEDDDVVDLCSSASKSSLKTSASTSSTRSPEQDPWGWSSSSPMVVNKAPSPIPLVVAPSPAPLVVRAVTNSREAERARVAASKAEEKLRKDAEKAEAKRLKEAEKVEAKRLKEAEKLEAKRARGCFAEEEICVIAPEWLAKAVAGTFKTEAASGGTCHWRRSEGPVTALAVRLLSGATFLDAAVSSRGAEEIARQCGLTGILMDQLGFRPQRCILAILGLDAALLTAQRNKQQRRAPTSTDVEDLLASLLVEHGLETALFETKPQLTAFISTTTTTLAKQPFRSKAEDPLDVAPRSKLISLEGGQAKDDWLRCLAVIPGLGDSKARALAAAYSSPGAVIGRASIEELERAFGTNRREKSLAKVVHAVFNSDDPHLPIHDDLSPQ